MSMTPQKALQCIIEHREILQDEMVQLMRQIMNGEVSGIMVAAILAGLRKEGDRWRDCGCSDGDARVLP